MTRTYLVLWGGLSQVAACGSKDGAVMTTAGCSTPAASGDTSAVDAVRL